MLNSDSCTKALCLFRVIIVIPIMNLLGCLALPIPSTNLIDKPFQEESVSIFIGVTTKEQIEKLLGAPDATRLQNSIYIYSRPQTIVRLLYLDSGHGLIRDFDRRHCLIIQFDMNSKVNSIDHLIGDGRQTATGIYVADTGLRSKQINYFGTFFPPATAPISDMLVLYAPVKADQKAKQFSVPLGKSGVFLYCERDYFDWLKPENAIIKVNARIDGNDSGDFGPEGYFYWELDPGEHFLAIVPIYPDPKYIRYDALTISCIENQIAYVKLTWKTKGFFMGEHAARLVQISDHREGQDEIMNRRMILDKISPQEWLSNHPIE